VVWKAEDAELLVEREGQLPVLRRGSDGDGGIVFAILSTAIFLPSCTGGITAAGCSTVTAVVGTAVVAGGHGPAYIPEYHGDLLFPWESYSLHRLLGPDCCVCFRFVEKNPKIVVRDLLIYHNDI
jgi:hypothetical protein